MNPTKRISRRATGAVALLLLPLCAGARLDAVAAERADPSRLTVDRIFASGDFHAEGFAGRWLEGRSGWVTLEKSTGPSGGRDLVFHDAETDRREVLVPAGDLVPHGETSPLAVEGYAWSRDRSRLLIFTRSRRVWRQNTRGDYWVLDRSSGELRRLGGDAPPSSLYFAKFSPGGERVAYVRDRNLWVEDLRERTVRKLTRSGGDRFVNGTFDWVYEEELGLRDGFRWSPDGRSILFWQIDTEGVRRYPLVDYTAGLYPEVRWFAYPKVGERNPACRVGLLDLAGGEPRWIELPGDPREHYVARMKWVEATGQIAIQQLDRLQQTDRLFLADPRTACARLVYHDHDDAWFEIVDELFWLEEGRSFTWVSERDGWRHIYLVSTETAEARLLTPGAYDVMRLVAVDEKAGILWCLASPEETTKQFLYRVPLSGGPPERVTPAEPKASWHDYRVSPDHRWAVWTRSSFAEPPVTELVRLPSHERVRTLQENRRLRERFGRLAREPVKFFRIDRDDGVSVDAWLVRPPGFDAKRKYPLIVYVYGEPAGRTVNDRWGGSGLLWHLLLAQRGYLVMSIDNRGTPAPRGRVWRKAVYRNVGVIAPREQAAALRKAMAERPWIDPERIGVWGWSGGGSMTLNAMFKFPELYHTGISIAPVPNQRYYDTIYQERYMGLPKDNVEGFREGSPIHFAKQLRGNLLLIHGTGDDNCHVQGAMALIDELVRQRKPFTSMLYPNRTHSIREGTNTTLHLRDLMERYFLEHLPPGAR